MNDFSTSFRVLRLVLENVTSNIKRIKVQLKFKEFIELPLLLLLLCGKLPVYFCSIELSITPCFTVSLIYDKVLILLCSLSLTHTHFLS